MGAIRFEHDHRHGWPKANTEVTADALYLTVIDDT